jgi:hypothetical protein
MIQDPLRESRTLYGLNKEGYKVAFVMCSDCNEHMSYCNCVGGVKAPSQIVRPLDSLVRI